MTDIKPHVWPELTEPKFGEWYPIDTAPNDGTWVMVYAEGAELPVVACYVLGLWLTMEQFSQMEFCGEDGWSPDYDEWNVTHWTPLPAPPK